ncbi:MAG: glycosyltransferase family 4 protein [Chitinispirillaceae bacterium]|nr:glycosyltransferase family 4 protein [Chitinispirillaceae bacterium]
MGKTIVILSEDFPEKTGGIAQWAAGVARELHELGYRVIVVTRRWKDLPLHPHGTFGFSLRYVNGSHWKKLRTWYWRRAIKTLYAEGNRPDILIATTWNAARGVLDIAATNGTKTVVAIMGLEVTRRMNFIKRWWCRQTLRKADVLLSISAFSKKRAAAIHAIPEQKIAVLPCGVDSKRFRPDIDASHLRDRLGLHDRKVLLTLARIVERKGQDQVIRSLPAIIRQVPDVVYCIAGDPRGDHAKALKRLAAGLHLERHVLFAGYVESADIPAWYNLCDVYLMPSREIAGDTEGFGITFLEANACEKPVIGGNSGGVVDAIENGKTGFLVDPLDPAAIAEKAVLLLRDKALAERLGKQGRERIEKGFTWRAVTERLREHIESPSSKAIS